MGSDAGGYCEEGEDCGDEDGEGDVHFGVGGVISVRVVGGSLGFWVGPGLVLLGNVEAEL